MIATLKTIFGLVALCGFFVLIGTAGADCDGNCMENSLSLIDTIAYMLIGISMMTGGILGVLKTA